MKRPWLPVVVCLAALTAAKIAVAAARAPFGDESFYYLCSLRPAPAYADHPFVTAMLVRLGTTLFGHHPFGLRAAFLAVGLLLVPLVWLLARPLCGRDDAWGAALFALAAPILAHVGAVALPDVPLLVLAAAFLALGVRALDRDDIRTWAGLGGVLALAFSTHLRAACFALGAAGFLLCSRGGRRRLHRPGPWIAALCAAPGLLPVFLFNLRLGFAPLLFQTEERHRGGAHPGALLEHVASQAGVVTPLIYAALLAAFVTAVRRARGGDERAAFLAWFAFAHLGLFFLASPFADSSHATVHWPAPGYLALLPFAPGVLRTFAERGRSRLRRAAPRLVPASGLAIVAAILVDLAVGWPGVESLHRPFVGWREAAARTRVHLAKVPPGPDGRRLLVADDYLLGGALRLFLGPDVDLFLLDHPKHFDHGRQLQFRLWDIDEAGLRRRRAGRAALLVFDTNQIRGRDLPRWRAHAHSLFESVEPLERLFAPGRHRDRPRFLFDLAVGVRAP